MPPLLIVFAPESVTEYPPEFGPAALKRRLLVDWPPMESFWVTFVLLPPLQASLV